MVAPKPYEVVARVAAEIIAESGGTESLGLVEKLLADERIMAIISTRKKKPTGNADLGSLVGSYLGASVRAGLLKSSDSTKRYII